MGLRRVIEPEAVAITGTAPVIAFVHRDIARSLSAQIAENHRLAFARSFAYAVMLACWRARGLPSLSPPDNVKLIPLSIDAAAAALAVPEYDLHRWTARHLHLRIKKTGRGNHDRMVMTRNF